MTGDSYVTFLPIPDNAGQAVITTRAEETGSERLSHTPTIAQQHEPSLPLRPTLSTKAGPCPRARLSLPQTREDWPAQGRCIPVPGDSSCGAWPGPEPSAWPHSLRSIRRGRRAAFQVGLGPWQVTNWHRAGCRVVSGSSNPGRCRPHPGPAWSWMGQSCLPALPPSPPGGLFR